MAATRSRTRCGPWPRAGCSAAGSPRRARATSRPARTIWCWPAWARSWASPAWCWRWLLFATLVVRALRIARRTDQPYVALLVVGLVTSLAAQALLIVGGLLGLLPLSGVVTPFLSLGRSSMVSNLAVVGLLLAASRQAPPAEEKPFFRPASRVGLVVVGAARDRRRPRLPRAGLGPRRHHDAADADPAGGRRGAAAGQPAPARSGAPAAARGDPRSARPADRDGLRRSTSARTPRNTRRSASARVASRTSGRRGRRHVRPGRVRRLPHRRGRPASAAIRSAAAPSTCSATPSSKANWAATNSTFVERDFDPRLRGYEDYSELLALWDHRDDPLHLGARAIRERPRDVKLTIDARLQARTAALLGAAPRRHGPVEGRGSGARRRDRRGARLGERAVAAPRSRPRRHGRGLAPARAAAPRPRPLRPVPARLHLQAGDGGGGAAGLVGRRRAALRLPAAARRSRRHPARPAGAGRSATTSPITPRTAT